MRHPRLTDWWVDSPDDPDRPTLDQPDVQRLIASLAPRAKASDLGGVMSLNMLLEPDGLVLRVHQPFVTPGRLLALQAVRRGLSARALLTPQPQVWRGEAVFRCGKRWAELEEYLPHERLKPAPETYTWLFGMMCRLHRELAALGLRVPRPLVATFAPPGSLRHWLPVTEAAVQSDPLAVEAARLVRRLANRLSQRWVTAAELPTQLIHGDIKPGNLVLGGHGQPVYLDFGFAAARPRVHDLAYALAFMVLALNGGAAEQFDWTLVPELIAAYEAENGQPLAAAERKALAAYTAEVPLHAAALDGFSLDPPGQLRSRLPFLRVSEWILMGMGNDDPFLQKG